MQISENEQCKFVKNNNRDWANGKIEVNKKGLIEMKKNALSNEVIFLNDIHLHLNVMLSIPL